MWNFLATRRGDFRVPVGLSCNKEWGTLGFQWNFLEGEGTFGFQWDFLEGEGTLGFQWDFIEG